MPKIKDIGLLVFVIAMMVGWICLSLYGPRQQRQDATDAALAACNESVDMKDLSLEVCRAQLDECENSLAVHILASTEGEDELP